MATLHLEVFEDDVEEFSINDNNAAEDRNLTSETGGQTASSDATVASLQNTTGSDSKKANVGASSSLKPSAIMCLPSKSFLNILEYGSSSSATSSLSSDESETDSADFIHVLKPRDSSESEWEENQSNNINNDSNYRDSRCPSSGDTSDSNESLDDDMEVGAVCAKITPKKAMRTEGELELDELPPVPDISKLSINVKTEDCIMMGRISNIVDRLITIESLPDIAAYDLDTLLFLDEGKVPLGYVFDVIGQVTHPIYVVRFNTIEEIASKGIAKGLPVYSAPKTQYTQYVFLKHLMQLKGSDASWRDDNEVPVEFLDFSDDENEFRLPNHNNANENPFRKKRRNRLNKHKAFEKTMNLKNEVNNARYRLDEVIVHPKANWNVPNRQLGFYQLPPASHASPSQSVYCGSNIYVPPHFNMPAPMFNMPMQHYPVAHFPPNPQFPPPTFGSPAIPPLPQMAQMSTQAPMGYHPAGVNVNPVMPKMPRLPRRYVGPLKYNNTGPHRRVNVNPVSQNSRSTLRPHHLNTTRINDNTTPPNKQEDKFKD